MQLPEKPQRTVFRKLTGWCWEGGAPGEDMEALHTLLGTSPYTSLSFGCSWVAPFPKIWLLLFSRSVMSDSLRPHGLHTRLLCPSPSPGVFSDSCPLSWWCHLTILSSVAPFSSCLLSFPSSGSFPMSWLFVWGGQSIGASVSVLPMNIQDWFPLGWTGWISFQSKDSQESSPIPQFKSINSSTLSFLYKLSHSYMTTGINHSFD